MMLTVHNDIARCVGRVGYIHTLGGGGLDRILEHARRAWYDSMARDLV